MKTPKASGALRWAPDPIPAYAHFARTTPLCYVGKIWLTRVGVRPLDQILDPLLLLPDNLQCQAVEISDITLSIYTCKKKITFLLSI